MRVAADSARSPAAVYTFSQPRAAGRTFAGRVREHGVPYYRFVSSIDPTPDTPFNPWSTVGSEYYVDASGNIYHDGTASFWNKVKNNISVDGSLGESREPGLKQLSKTIGIAAHSVERYFEPLYSELKEIG